jgi:hypothetical protein
MKMPLAAMAALILIAPTICGATPHHKASGGSHVTHRYAGAGHHHGASASIGSDERRRKRN